MDDRRLRTLPKKFTLSELQRVYEIILQRPVDKRNFRKKILAQGQIRELDETRGDVAYRPARLYAFHENQPRPQVGLITEKRKKPYPKRSSVESDSVCSDFRFSCFPQSP